MNVNLQIFLIAFLTGVLVGFTLRDIVNPPLDPAKWEENYAEYSQKP
jgi:hypothetical protein